MGTLRKLFVLLVAASAVVLPAFATPAGAVSSTERYAETYLFSIINTARKNARLGTLREHSYIRGQSEYHSYDMLRRRTMDHAGFYTRVSRIRANDAGIRYGGVCENVAAASYFKDYQSAMRAIFNGWYRSTDHYKCMYDKYGWSTQSAAVGARYDGRTWWVTFMAAHDTTR